MGFPLLTSGASRDGLSGGAGAGLPIAADGGFGSRGALPRSPSIPWGTGWKARATRTVGGPRCGSLAVGHRA